MTVPRTALDLDLCQRRPWLAVDRRQLVVTALADRLHGVEVEPSGARWGYYGHDGAVPQRRTMSPVERNKGHTLTAVVVAGAGVIVAMGAAFGLAMLGSSGDVDIRLGDDEARIGNIEQNYERVRDEGPILFPDPAGGDRDVVIQNLGDDPQEGWLAIAARPADAPVECAITWQEDDGEFALLDRTDGREGELTGDCDGRTYPADGGDLPTYEVTVRDETLYLDPRSDERPEEDSEDEG